jgi:hypothetical protein
MIMRMKSGNEFHFSCESYTIKSIKFSGEITEFTYEGGRGECPIYFRIGDIESIAEVYEAEVE